MATWTMDQVRQVRGLYVRMTLDPWHDQPEQAAEFACDKLFRQLTRAAHTHAVELHPGDCEVDRGGDGFRHVTLTMRWAPSSPVVELRGGPADGQRIAVPRVGDAIKVATRATTPGPADAHPAEAEVSLASITYAPAGWNEAERVWVYAPA